MAFNMILVLVLGRDLEIANFIRFIYLRLERVSSPTRQNDIRKDKNANGLSKLIFISTTV